jgi:hypothetical protein
MIAHRPMTRATPSDGSARPSAAAATRARGAAASVAVHAACFLLACTPLFALAWRGALLAPLWMDEVNYFVYATNPDVREVAPGQPVTSFQGIAFCFFSYPTLLQPYLAVLEGAGDSLLERPEVPLRLPSFLFAVAAAAFTYAAIWSLRRDRLLASVAAAAFAATPLVQFYAFEARVYSLAAAAGLLFLWLSAGVGAEPSRRRLAAAGAVGALLPWISIWCVPLLAGPLVVWLAARSGAPSLRRSPGPGLAATAVMTLPGVAVAALQLVFLVTDFAYQTQMRYSGSHGWRLLPRLAWELPTGPGHLGQPPPVGLVVASAAAVAVAVGLLVAALLRSRLDGASARLALHWLAALATLGIAGGVVRGFVPGRYELPVVAGLFLALAQLPRRAALATLATLLALGLAAFGSTDRRIAGKSSTRPMAEHVLEHGDPAREGILTRQHFGWDPLHRYTTWLYAERREPRWRARTYPRLEPLAEDFMLFRTVVDTPASRELSRSPDDPRVREWVRREGFAGLWVLSPDSVDPRPLAALLEAEGFALRQRVFFGGYPESWLLHYQRGPVS